MDRHAGAFLRARLSPGAPPGPPQPARNRDGRQTHGAGPGAAAYGPGAIVVGASQGNRVADRGRRAPVGLLSRPGPSRTPGVRHCGSGAMRVLAFPRVAPSRLRARRPGPLPALHIGVVVRADWPEPQPAPGRDLRAPDLLVGWSVRSRCGRQGLPPVRPAAPCEPHRFDAPNGRVVRAAAAEIVEVGQFMSRPAYEDTQARGRCPAHPRQSFAQNRRARLSTRSVSSRCMSALTASAWGRMHSRVSAT